MPHVDERLAFALRQQLLQWQARLATDAERVGWKVGRGIVDGLEDLEPVIGYLTTATRLEPDATYRAGNTKDLRVDAEIAVEIGEDRRASGFAAGLEIVDVGRPPDDFDAIVADNVFHRAFELGASRPTLPGHVEARILVDGELRAEGTPSHDLGAAVERVAALLDAVGERLEPGDRILTGLVVQAPVAPGNEVEVDFGELGRLAVEIR